MKYRYLFGPVPSRRFGRSLGIDMVPAKTCSFDCPFCEVGSTTLSTCKLQEYIPTSEIISEFKQWLKDDGQADVITLAGSGEPTLHSHFGEIIDTVKSSCNIPVVILTNSTLLHIPQVRQAAAKADIVKCSLSAWDDKSFQRINRPADELQLQQVVDGLREFRKIFPGKLWLEVFILKSVNDKPSDVAKIAALAETIAPDAVQLNTVVRPPAESSAQPISHSDLLHLAPLFTPPAEIIARFSSTASTIKTPNITAEHVLAMLMRRPCSAKDISGAFNITDKTADTLIKQLLKQNAITPIKRSDTVYYKNVIQLIDS
jgi:wyosine [tRNA(Phe)-imidazoG37] synthetase (radical SAM superfamily)